MRQTKATKVVATPTINPLGRDVLAKPFFTLSQQQAEYIDQIHHDLSFQKRIIAKFSYFFHNKTDRENT